MIINPPIQINKNALFKLEERYIKPLHSLKCQMDFMILSLDHLEYFQEGLQQQEPLVIFKLKKQKKRS